MSTGQVLDWIKSINLGKYTSVFVDMDVDGDMLVNDLDFDTLMSEDFGLKSVHAKKLLRKVSEFKTKNDNVAQKNVGEADNHNSNSNSSAILPSNMIDTAVLISQAYDDNSNSNADSKISGVGELPGSIAHTIKGCAGFLGKLQPDISCIGDVVTQSTDNWKAINAALESLRPIVGDEQISSMKKIHRDYWSLLLETSQVMSVLTTRSKSRTRMGRTILKLLKQQSNGNVLSDNDKLRFHSCLTKVLGGWANTELNELVKGWKDITERLSVTYEHWKTYKTTAVKESLSVAARVLLSLGGLVVVGGMVTLAILTCGIAAPVEIAIISVISGCMIGATVGVAANALLNFTSNMDVAFSNKDTMLLMQEKLHQMLQGCKLIQDGLSDSLSIIKCIGVELDDMSKTSLDEMWDSLSIIIDSLEKFTNQGIKVSKVVRKARDDYLQT